MDPNIFAHVLCNAGTNTFDAFKLGANRHRFVPSTRVEVERSRRESSPLETPSKGGKDSLDLPDRLELRFNNDEHPLKDPSEGWLFGSSPLSSDVVICPPSTAGVSRRHFSLSITPDLRIQFHQLSAQSTRITYCCKASGLHEIHPQKGDKFIICLAPSEPQYWNLVGIDVGPWTREVNFDISFPNQHTNATPEYYDNLREWVQMKASAVPPTAGLGCFLILPRTTGRLERRCWGLIDGIYTWKEVESRASFFGTRSSYIVEYTRTYRGLRRPTRFFGYLITFMIY